ncbi:MAG: WD40 repeat domain-containing protein, partial [Candidatus Thalassarchaeaceae archaeon]|nr:WD40 repeat domain-containing protein [Candidatus Thalassarchaeaceae archaeon]
MSSERFVTQLGVALMLVLIPASASASTLVWTGSTEISTGDGLGYVVQYSNSGNILASSHHNELMFIDPVTLIEEYHMSLDWTIEALTFSENDQYLVVGMESLLPNTPATVVLQLVEGKYQRMKHSEDGINVDRLSFAPDGVVYSSVTEDNSITEWSILNGTFDLVGIDRSYPVAHDGAITCMDHSLNSEHILTGAEDGLVILWNRSDQTIFKDWNIGSPVKDCSFSHDGSMMSWLSDTSISIRNYDETH